MPKPILRALTLRRFRKGWASKHRLQRARNRLAAFPRHRDMPRHSLPARLVVSLTSYPARYGTLHLTIKSILDQTVKPDQVLLWLAHDDLASLPENVRSLEGDLFQVRACAEMRSFKKILPAILAEPQAFIVTADDDTYYPDTWLADLADAFDPANPSVVCHRAHQIRYQDDGSIAPYRQWTKRVRGPWTELPRTDLLPTGNGGILYPPGSLPPMAADYDLIQRLCATCDDTWLYFMWRSTGCAARRVSGKMRKFDEWPGSQEESLTAFHAGGRKDEHIQAMSRHFGVPR